MLLISSLSFLSAIYLATAAAAPIVDLGYAQYQGVLDPVSNNTHYIGIRFAAPPIGDLRFAAPKAPSLVPGVQQADKFASQCFQAPLGGASTNPFNDRLSKRDVSYSEDCLFLNVYVPGHHRALTSKLKPVVVWIHGGGYIFGGTQGFFGTDIQNGDDLIKIAAPKSDVIAVIIAYRLGLFGFLAGKEMKNGGALNAGLLDQEFALKWVQKHASITKFGGDPNRVTIWGESAGGGAVLQQMTAHNGNTHPPLFRGAIASSPYLLSQYEFDANIPQRLYNEVVSQSKCTSATRTLACLRHADADSLESINIAIGAAAFFGTTAFAPVVDGDFIRQSPTKAIAEGKLNGEALYTIANTDESSPFVDATTKDTVDVSTYIKNIFPTLDSSNVTKATALYSPLGSPFAVAKLIMSEGVFVCAAYTLLKGYSRIGNAFKSQFAIPPGGHGDDLAYYFPSAGYPLHYNNTVFAQSFTEAFMSFVIDLDPGKKIQRQTITPHWNPWNGGFEMLFNRTEAGVPDVRAIKTDTALLDRCSFWNSVSSKIGH